jgi:NAD(P)H-dependent glutamate synthase small subunit
MGKPTGFMEYERELPRRRPVSVRLRDWREVYEPFPVEATQAQGARCMDCGIPFCHDGCPLGNLIPEWNDLVYRDDWTEAIERLHGTNNFPEFTGRLCPAPCEAACVLGINDDPVTIERIEYEIVERAWSEGWVTPVMPSASTGRSVAVVGSGPAGLAAAQQLARAGHAVTVFERAEKPGGLLRYGIPEFKMEKAVLDQRLAQLEAEGVVFVCATSVGAGAGAGADDGPAPVGAPVGAPVEPGEERGLGRACAPDVTVRSAADVRAEFDAVVLAAGPRCPGTCPSRGGPWGASIWPWSTSSRPTWCARAPCPTRPSAPRESTC